eukprot:scaffold15108_cov180-Amphora_coffeaeformis.AAC.71
MVALAGHTEIQVQQKTKLEDDEDEILFHDCTLLQAFDLMMDSSPGNSFFAFVEGLLEEADGNDSRMYQRVQQPLTNARERLFQTYSDGGTEKDGDSSPFINWFDFFPRGAKPTDCVILAGQGASSTFHRDPFEWLGTSLCLEGRKIWRFVQPIDQTLRADKQEKEDSSSLELDSVQRVDDFLQAYRLESIAWDAGDGSSSSSDMVLSAGWQSDMSLYQKVDNENIPSAKELAFMDTVESNSLLDDLAASTTLLGPSISMQQEDTKHAVEGFYSTVQRQGDLLLIPAHWYHQTYAPEPSLAVASQRCGSFLDAKRVFRHVLSQQNGLPPSKIPNTLTQSESGFANHNDPEALVNELFAFLTSRTKEASMQERIRD